MDRAWEQHLANGVTQRDDRQGEIEAQAAEWVARLGGGPLGAAERHALELWLAEDTRHAAAFDEARLAWALMDAVAADPGALGLDLSTPPAMAPRPAPRPRLRVRWRPALALAASLLLLVAAAVLWVGDPLAVLIADHRTAPGERRAVVLPDGSLVELGPASAIALDFTAEERRVELLAGLAYFTAAPRAGSERRPFVVRAADGTARALGTEFAVDRQADAVEVVVVEHQVAVAVALPDGGAAEVVLSPGQAVRYAGRRLAGPRATELEQALAWRRDRLVFDRVPLERVVSELNRYRRGRIVIGSAALATRLVSGVFDTGDPDAALQIIARELGARTVSAPLITLLY